LEQQEEAAEALLKAMAAAVAEAQDLHFLFAILQ
jgi:hypothetical protein